MSTFLYDHGRQAFLEGTIAWLTDNIKVALVTSGYTPNQATDQFLAIVTSGNIVVTSANLATKTSTAGVADADDFTLTAVSGSAIVALVVYKDTGSDATSPLIAYIDNYAGLPLTPTGADETFVFPSDAAKIFAL
jgi:hypothetical protein